MNATFLTGIRYIKFINKQKVYALTFFKNIT